MDQKKIIKVTCAIIERDGKILAAQRSENMGMGLKWEFPGGKVEPGERPEDCIARELKEELGIEAKVKQALPSHIHDYGTKVIELIPFICEIKNGRIECREHKQVLWDKPQNLTGLEWANADVPILHEYLRYLGGKQGCETEGWTI